MPQGKSKIETELLAASGLKRTKNEAWEAYAPRLVKAVGELPDKTWNDLSTAAQEWTNAGVDAIESKTAIAEFPDVEEPAEEPAEEVEVAEAAAAPVKQKGSAMAKKKVAAAAETEEAAPAARKKVTKAAAAPAAKAPKVESSVTAIRKAVIKKPNAPAESILEVVKVKHPDVGEGTVNTTRANTRAVLALLPEYADKVN